MSRDNYQEFIEIMLENFKIMKMCHKIQVLNAHLEKIKNNAYSVEQGEPFHQDVMDF